MSKEENKKVYGFEIFDNDSKAIEGFMLYTKRNNLLRPALKKFEQGWKELFTFEGMVTCLEYNKIAKLFTYHPDSQIICCHPYEINNEFEFELCGFEGWNRFNHLEIFLSPKEKETLQKAKIELIHLKEEEISELERNLRFHITY